MDLSSYRKRKTDLIAVRNFTNFFMPRVLYGFGHAPVITMLINNTLQSQRCCLYRIIGGQDFRFIYRK